MTTDSYIQADKQGRTTALVGADATLIMRAASCKMGINLHIRTGGGMVITRGMTISRLLAIASEFSGKKYKKSAAGYAQAVADLDKWIETMKAALPVVREGE